VWLHTLWWVLAIALMLGGLVATVLPGPMGVLLIYAGVWLAAWNDGFARIGWPTLTLLGVLAALALGVDLVASLLGARRAGASRAALLGSVIGGIAGIGAGLPGLVLGPFIGAFLGELLARRSVGDAARVGFATWLGMALGTLARIALAVSMLAIFTAAWLI